MKAINNWENVKASSDFTTLPAGGYVCRIQGAKISEFNGSNGTFERLEVAVDIEEGEHKGYYRQDFESQQTEDKKWRGVFRLYVPSGDGSDKDNWSAAKLKRFVNNVEDSNPGYHWDWDEKKLKGKLVGLTFRKEEWEYNGKTGWKTNPFQAYTVDDIRQNKFNLPKDKPLNGNKTTAAPSVPKFEDIVDTTVDDDLPFGF
ncbi:MAG: hypothetical protein ACOYBL_13325 [Lachnospiraceae bacterium]|jgi:hypothetical protein